MEPVTSPRRSPALARAEIIDLVKELAAASGAPPGRERFESQTGVSSYAWQRYWGCRWSDVLADAGLVPNEFQKAYNRSELLEAYANLTKELGRIPTGGDLIVKSNQEPDFPARTTFDRLGTKAVRVTQLAEYCRGRSGYENVLQLCEEYAPRQRGRGERDPETEIAGIVYLLKSGRFYKIGRTNAAGRRQYELDLQLPEKARWIHSFETDDPVGIEAYWHKRFEPKRKNGEWFELNAADVSAFKKRRRFM